MTSLCPQRTVQLKKCPPFCKRELPTRSLELLVRAHRSTPAEGRKALQGHPRLMSTYRQDPPVSVSAHQARENHHIGQRPQASLSPLRLPRLPNGCGRLWRQYLSTASVLTLSTGRCSFSHSGDINVKKALVSFQASLDCLAHS